MIKSAITHIELIEGVALVTVCGLDDDVRKLAQIFRAIANRDVGVDMITFTPQVKNLMNLTFAVSSEELGVTVSAVGGLRREIPGMICHISSDNTAITLTGTAVSEDEKLVSDVMETVSSLGTAVKMICSSVNEISLVIDGHFTDEVVSCLRERYIK
ncbi:MAG: hypothetical protein IKB50_03080 [Clostridia bacterium]|nr:hypothetical protein [Clostridia bacterium]